MELEADAISHEMANHSQALFDQWMNREGKSHTYGTNQTEK